MSWIESPENLICVLDNLPNPLPDWQDHHDHVSYDLQTHDVEIHISRKIPARLLGELCWALDHFEELERKARQGAKL